MRSEAFTEILLSQEKKNDRISVNKIKILFLTHIAHCIGVPMPLTAAEPFILILRSNENIHKQKVYLPARDYWLFSVYFFDSFFLSPVHMLSTC